MVNKRTTKAVKTLRDALDYDRDPDFGFIEALGEELFDSLFDVIYDVNLALEEKPVTDGRGRKAGKGPAWEAAYAYYYLNPAPRRKTHFARDTNKQLFANSPWAEEFVRHLEAKGVSMDQAKYMFDRLYYLQTSKKLVPGSSLNRTGPRSSTKD